MRVPRWLAISDSAFAWEREALELIREHLPDHEPWRAWSNFEFLDDEGRVNEVDALILTPQGLLLVEIKSRPGTLEGDAHSWTWTTDSRRRTDDNPLRLADRKAKRLASLIRKQDALARSKLRPPWVEPLIFLSKVRPPLKIDAATRTHVFLRGRPGHETDDGIVSALTGGLAGAFPSRTPIDANAARAIVRAIEQSGIRPSLREKRVGDYELGLMLAEGEGWQDFAAEHVSLKVQRRVRIYPYAIAASSDARARLGRLAAREFQILEGVEHPGILRVLDFRETDRGPALIFEHDPSARRLDHLLRDQGQELTTERRLDLIRQIAETLHYAHEKRLYHRALAPDSVLVRDLEGGRPQIQIMNWQTAARTDSGAVTPHRTSGTSHIEDYVADPAKVYLAPETREGVGRPGPHQDVFSLGAITYHLFTGQPPAASPLELPERLKSGGGLRLSQAIDGVGQDLEDLVRYSTHPDVSSRIASVAEFLEYLAEAEKGTRVELVEGTVDPVEAKPGDPLGHDLVLVRRLGRGASAEALLVIREGEKDPLVLKIASDARHNERLVGEAEVLRRLNHANIVRFVDVATIAGRVGIIMEAAGERSLAQHLKGFDPPSLDLMRRFGEELLQAVDYLEQEGVSHRDIKPDNIGVTKTRGSGQLRLVLFDFSLARTSPDNIEVGTRSYLDPFLRLRKPPRFDLYAERFAAAMTLYEMLTGTLPQWGDGLSDPAVLDLDMPTIEADRFDPNLREGLSRFFERALRREAQERFDNANEMLRAWTRAFEPMSRHPDAGTSLELIAPRINAGTSVAELGYSIEAQDVLTKMGVHSVQQLLAIDRRRFRYLKNVGERVRKEIRLVAKHLSQLRSDLVPGGTAAVSGRASIDRLYDQLLPLRPLDEETTEDRVLSTLLGMEANDQMPDLPTPGDAARSCGVARSVVATALQRARERWHKSRDLNELRDDVAGLLVGAGGVMAARELAQALLAARGSVERDEAERLRVAHAVLRAALELEAARAEPRFALFADDQPALVAASEDFAIYARLLGLEADKLAALDPLLSPERVGEALEQVPRPDAHSALSPQRLVRLAATASGAAALSSRLELYPRGMPAGQALRLALGSLAGARMLTPEQIRERVHGRYPESEPLPDRPALDRLLEEAGAEREWRERGDQAPGYYARHLLLASSSGTTPHRYDTLAPAIEATAEVLEARTLEEKLSHAARTGGFLALTIVPRHLGRAEAELLRRFPRQLLSFDRLLIEAMREEAESRRVRWPVVLAADATPRGSRDFQNLLRLVGFAAPKIQARILALREPALLVHPGLIARYDLMKILVEARDASGTKSGPPGLWLLIPQASAGLPTIDGIPVPVLSTTQWARLTEAWISNAHRAGTKPAA